MGETFLAIYSTVALVFALVLIYVMLPKKLGMVLSTIETELELIEELRHLIADLGSRDPQLTEHMELAAISLAAWERVLRGNARAIRRVDKLGLVRRPRRDES